MVVVCSRAAGQNGSSANMFVSVSLSSVYKMVITWRLINQSKKGRCGLEIGIAERPAAVLSGPEDGRRGREVEDGREKR